MFIYVRSRLCTNTVTNHAICDAFVQFKVNVADEHIKVLKISLRLLWKFTSLIVSFSWVLALFLKTLPLFASVLMIVILNKVRALYSSPTKIELFYPSPIVICAENGVLSNPGWTTSVCNVSLHLKCQKMNMAYRLAICLGLAASDDEVHSSIHARIAILGDLDECVAVKITM